MNRSLGSAAVGVVVMLACVVGLTGCPCVGSLYPMYEEGDLVADSGLEGRWRFVDADSEQPSDPEGKDIVVVSKMEKSPEKVLCFDIPPILPPSLYIPKDLPGYCIEPYKKPEDQDRAVKEEACGEGAQVPPAGNADGGDGEDYTIRFYVVDLNGKRFVDIAAMPEVGSGAPTHLFARLRKVEAGFEVDLLDQTWLVDHIGKKRHALRYEILPVDRGDNAVMLLTSKPKALQRFLLKHYDTPDAWETFGRFERVAPEKAEVK